MTNAPKKQAFIPRLLGALTRVDTLEAEKSRLEAFLSAFPGEYCGIARDGSIIYSPDFCKAINVDTIISINDVQSALSPSDAAAFEGMVDRLQEDKIPFTITAKTLDEQKTLKISGSHGENLAKTDHFNIIWAEDITAQIKAQAFEAAQKQDSVDEFQQIRTAIDSIPRPVWLRNTSQNLVWVNSTYTDYLEKPLIEIIEQQKEITPASKKTQNKDSTKTNLGPPLAKEALTTGTVTEATAHGIFHGKRLLLKISEIPLTSLGMTLGIAYNITKEEELENTLTRFQSSTNELLEQLRSAIAIYDADQSIEFYNSAFTQLWGLESGWLNKKPKLGEVMEKLRENRRLPEQSDFRSYKQTWLDMFTNLLKPFEDMIYLPDGTALRMLVVPHSMGGLMMTFEDVSSRLELESSYNTLMAVQKETLDNLAEGVAVYGSDGRIKLWNPAFTSMWKLNPEDLEEHPHVNRIIDKKKPFFAEDEWNARRAELVNKVLSRAMERTRLKRHPKDANEELIDIITVPLPDGGVLITFSDVTSTVAVENALREKAAALETAEQLKTDFLANVSYQLRTPLNSIIGFSEILQNEYFGPLNERQKDYTSDIQTASGKLLGLINDILDLSTLEAGYLNLDREDFKIRDMLDHVAELVGDWARKGNVEITVDSPSNIGTMNADERRIQQAIINVIRNALAFTEENGTIAITAMRKRSEIHFVIKDSGIGISQEDKVRIFQPFERAKSGTKSGLTRSGTGVGLALVRSITEAHNGHVKLDSETGEGTTVTLVIPLSSTKTSFKIPEK